VIGKATRQAEEDGKDRDFVTALARGLELLRCFTPEQGMLGNQELAAKTGLPKPTVSRLTYTLTKLGCLKKHASSGKYHLDVGVLAFGYQMLSNLTVRTIAHPFMEELAGQLGAAVAMAARDRLQMVYLDSAVALHLTKSPAQMAMRRQVGSYLPLHLSAVGRACLAGTPEQEREQLLAQLRERHRDDWDTIQPSLERTFRDYAEKGYCLSLGDWAPEVNGIAVPMAHKDYGILAVNCAGPAYDMPAERLEQEVGPRLKHMVGQIQAAVR
jgi:DNA-binding IclR family transcriptional regulator